MFQFIVSYLNFDQTTLALARCCSASNFSEWLNAHYRWSHSTIHHVSAQLGPFSGIFTPLSHGYHGAYVQEAISNLWQFYVNIRRFYHTIAYTSTPYCCTCTIHCLCILFYAQDKLVCRNPGLQFYIAPDKLRNRANEIFSTTNLEKQCKLQPSHTFVRCLT